MKLSVEQIPGEAEEEVIVRCHDAQEKWVEAIRGITAGEIDITGCVDEKIYRILVRLFGSGKGSGAAFLFAILWLAGIGVCVIFRADRHIWNVEPNTVRQKTSRDSF